MNAPHPLTIQHDPASAVHLAIDGMHCASCVARVERALLAVPGVASAAVNLATERADITTLGKVARRDLVVAVAGAGYKVPDTVTDLLITGMTCASCVARLEGALRALPGVTSATVNLATERAQVTGAAATSALITAVAALGYHAELAGAAAQGTAGPDRKAAYETQLRRDLLVALVLTMPVVVLEMGGHLVPAMHDLIHNTIGMDTSRLIQFVLTTLVLIGPGRRFFVTGVPALVRARPDMNSLVALGAVAAYAVSVVVVLAPWLMPAGMADVYFEPAAVIVTLILIGRYLEARAKGRAAGAIAALIGLQPKVARVRRGFDVTQVPIDQLALGDLVEIRPGERVPADGLVTEGTSWIDAAMISGEPIPVEAAPGAALVGGTVNQTGALTLRVTAVGAASTLSQIIRMVEDAQGAKLPIQALVDKVTMWFVPAVLALAALTGVVWLIFGPDPALSFALVNAVAVLIIACPCAMGLATPTSILAGTGRGAELGILFRRGDALQRLAEIKVVAFDKTGTLTIGRPRLTDLSLATGFDRAEVLGAVAAVEARSEHPVARALVAAATEEGLRPATATRVIAAAGLGIVGQVGDQKVQIGSARYLEKHAVELAALATQAAALGGFGKTVLYVAINGQAAAVLAVADEIRPGAAAAIRALKDRGLRVAMISGDARATAEAVARDLGIDDVRAEVLPGAKRDVVKALSAAHGALAFVGDGINDAPALAAADVGISVGSGTDVAIEAADVVLMSSNPGLIPVAIRLSQATMANIKENLFWAFAYNAALIPVAAGVLYPARGILLSPALAAGAMALSSLFVLANALRLSRFAAPIKGDAA
jgi:heavy metal translocating P-type ATPase